MLLVGLVVLNAAGIIFLYRRQDQTENKVAESIMKNIEERQQIEESIRRELDLKRKEKDFILIQDQQRQAQDIQQRLNELKNALELALQANVESTKLWEGAHKQLESYVKNLEDNFNQQHEQYRMRLDASDGVVLQLKKQLETQLDQHTRDMQRLEDSYAEHAQDLTRRLAEFNATLANFNRSLDECRARLNELANAGMQQASAVAKQ